MIMKNSYYSSILIIAFFYSGDLSIKYLSLLLITFIALIASIEFKFGDFNFRIADQGIFNFPFIWHFNTWIASILKLFLAIVIVSMMANEYSNRTLKQNLIDGLSKKEFILSKFYTVIVFSIVSTLVATEVAISGPIPGNPKAERNFPRVKFLLDSSSLITLVADLVAIRSRLDTSLILRR